MEKEKGVERLNFARSTIFFFDIFLALMLISASYLLIKNELGIVSLLFGGFMLVLSVTLRILKQW